MKLLFYSLCMLFISSVMMSQEVNPDEVMKQIRREVENGRYDAALSLINPLREKFPQDEDIKVYSGRIYSWKKDYNTAIEILSPMADRANPNPEALLAIINVYYWSEQFEKCINYCDKYLAINPDSTDVVLIKVKCLERLNRDEEALAIMDKTAFSDNSTQAFTGMRALIGSKAKNALTVSYLNISTYDPGQSPMHFGYVEYSRKFTKSSLVGRVNAGYANNDTQLLFEADYYQAFKKRNYLYINAGVSTGETIFPVAKGGIEYYFTPYKKFEFSAGFRYLHFQTDDVSLVTGQIAYHPGSYTFAYRPYYDISNELFSHVLSLQYGNEEKESIIRFELQYGNVPYLYLYTNFTTPLNAYRAGLQYQFRAGNGILIRPVVLYEYEEYIPSEYRHRLNAQIIITKRF